MIVSMYSKNFRPGDTIVDYGERNSELMIVLKGNVQCYTKEMYKFIILPVSIMIGEY